MQVILRSIGFLFLLTGSLLFSNLLYADPIGKVNYFFVKDTLDTRLSQTFLNELKVVNLTNSAKRLIRKKITPTGILVSLPDTIDIPANSSALFPIKYLASRKNIQATVSEFSAGYYSTDKDLSLNPSAIFHVRVPEESRVLTAPVQKIIYSTSLHEPVSFELKCSNMGYKPERIRIGLGSLPNDLRFEQEETTLLLEPGTSRNIIIRCLLPRHSANPTDYIINILATVNGSNEYNSSVRLITLGNTKRLTSSAPGNLPDNSIELTAAGRNSGLAYQMLRANGSLISEEKNSLEYSMNAAMYNNTGSLNIQDTYLKFKGKHIGLQAGNIMEPGEYLLYGRGIKASAYNKKNTVDLFYLNNSYSLYSSFDDKNGYSSTWAASYAQQLSASAQTSSQFIYTDDPASGKLTGFLNSSGFVQIDSLHKLEFTGGYSFEKNRNLNISSIGYAGGFNYSGQIGKLQLSLNNFLSSPYFSGTRRGTIQLNNSILYSFNSKNKLAGRFSKLSSSPQWLSDNKNLYSYYSGNETYELLYSASPSSDFSFGLRPYYQKQQIDDMYSLSSHKRLSSNSARLAIDLTYSMGRGNALSLSADAGQVSSSMLKNNYQSYRFTLNYYNSVFGCNTFYQNGAMMLSEEYSSDILSKPGYFTASPYLNFAPLKEKLSISLSSFHSYNKATLRWTSTINSTIKYNMPQHWQMKSQVFLSGFTRYSSNNQVMLSLLKSFNITNKSDVNKLELTFFTDKNGNGKQDADEKELEGVLVNLADITAMSNGKGKVSFENLQPAVYKISIMNSNEWNIAAPMELLVSKNTRLAVPLVKNGKIAGSVKPLKQRYNEGGISLEGIRVTASDARGQSYFTLTDKNGEFTLSLPVNEYNVQVEETTENYTISNPQQRVSVNSKGADQIVFTLLDESRTIHVQKF